MFRLVYLTFLTCVFFIAHVPLALAQDNVRVRLGDHSKYSRMVVDWGKRVPYQLKKTGSGQAVLEFKQNGNISDNIQGVVLSSIKDVRAVALAPLSLAFTYPKDSRIREFYIDNRLVVDVFKSPSGGMFSVQASPPKEAPKPPEKPVEQTAQQSSEPAKVVEEAPPAQEEVVVQIKPEQPEQPKEDLISPDEKKPEEIKSTASEESHARDNEQNKETAAAQEEVHHQEEGKPGESVSAGQVDVKADDVHEAEAEHEMQETNVKPSPEELAQESVQEIKESETKEEEPKFSLANSDEDEGANLITFSMNKATSMAAFRLHNKLWMIHNNPDNRIPPKVSGDQKDKLEPLGSLSGKGGQVFSTQPYVKADKIVKGKGGGVLWDFVVADENKSAPDTRQANLPEIVFQDINGVTTASVEFPMKNASGKTEIIDPVTGWPIKIVTAKTAENYVPEQLDFVDFTVLPSPVGLAVLPKVDDLEVLLTGRDVKIFRPDGLHVEGAQLSAQNVNILENMNEEVVSPANEPRIYLFNDWALNDVNALNRSRMATLSLLNSLPRSQQMEQLTALAKAYLAQGMGPEALGLLNWMGMMSPTVQDHPEYKAMQGLANALMARPEEAFSSLSDKALEKYPEIKYWKSYVLAEVGNWDLAYRTMPRSLATLKTYPSPIFNRIASNIAEVYLRAGYPQKAKELLNDLQNNADKLYPEQRAALTYLQGEYARQLGDIKKTKEYWGKLAEGDNDLYRTKAGLALTRMRVEEKDIPLKLALNDLEKLRYVWRGDELEAQVHYWLGHTYAEDNQYARALNIMREGASMSELPGFAEDVTREMSEVFIDVFLNKKLEGVSALEAATLYEQFSELAPSDGKENDVVNVLANYMAKANLLSRSISLLKHQYDHRLSGREKFDTGLRLSAFYLLDNKQKEALTTLEELDSIYAGLPESLQSKEKYDEMKLLRVQALAKNSEYNEALFLLDRMDATADVNAMRADIAWRAGFWDDAADAMDKMIADRSINLSHRLTDSDRDLLLQYGVALNLANDRIGLTDLRERYAALMDKTSKGDVFEIITRPRRTPGLADRDTLLSVVAETDLFGSFLENYRTAGE